jgi:hypothetical protein
VEPAAPIALHPSLISRFAPEARALVALRRAAPFHANKAEVFALVCIGTGLTIAVLALGVVLAFFVKDKEVEPIEPPTAQTKERP